MARWWDDHSLTIVLVALGSGFMGLSLLPEPGKLYDFVLGLGHGCWTAALLNLLSGPLRERNRPDE